jgi:hypothetical protein
VSITKNKALTKPLLGEPAYKDHKDDPGDKGLVERQEIPDVN